MLGKGLGAPYPIRAVFLAVMLVLTTALGWLGWRVLEQDRQLGDQRLTERRETAADLTVAALERRLSSVDREIGAILLNGKPADSSALGDGALFVKFQPGRVEVWPERGLIYYPEVPEVPEASPALFSASDELEFRKQDYHGALAVLRAQAESTDSAVRAAALIRIARNLLKNGQPRESRMCYEQLSALGSTPVGGMPATFAAASGLLAVFEHQKDRASLDRTARALYRDLHSGQWPIASSTYHYLSEEARRFLPDANREFAPSKALAEGVDALWERWHRKATSASGRALLDTSSVTVLLVWRVTGPAMAAFVASRDHLEHQWLADMKLLLDSRGVRLSLAAADGRRIAGQGSSRDSAANGSQHPAVRLVSSTQFPWTVQVFSVEDGQEALRLRRSLLIAGLCVLLALILTGGWFIGRSVERELAVARLQSDFVSAVSHEFRTPLTTIYQLSELLTRGRVASEQDRQQYYALLHKESARLRHLVEGLLNFGRLDAGRMQYRFETLDAAALVRQTAAEFSAAQQRPSHLLEVTAQSHPVAIRGDREALHCVFWNLFENAVKYSPDCDRVWITIAENARQVEIGVRDRGVGIPRGEQRRVFEKFVRGSAARERNIRGTGIGLALSRQIVCAHGGEIQLESEPGKGSTFRVLLPGTE